MKQRLIALTKQLVRIPSVSADAQKIDLIISTVKWLFETYPNVFLETHVENGKPSLIIQNFSWKHADIALCGHLDVVPASEEGQFEPYEEDGKLYGRGCADMKDGCAIIITLMQELLSMWYTDKKIALRLTTDEEVGGVDGMWALVKHGWSTDVALIPDSGDVHDVTIATKGILTIWLQVHGKATHSSRPRRGDNALEKAYTLYQEIKKSIEEPDLLVAEEKYRWTSVQLTELSGWVAMNVTPGEATMTINIRHVESYTEDSLRASIEPLLEKYTTDLVKRSYGNIMSTSEDNLIVQKYKKIAEELVWPITLSKEHGSTDGAHLPAATTVILHQPTDAHIHSKGEYTMIDELEKIYEIYKMFILS